MKKQRKLFKFIGMFQDILGKGYDDLVKFHGETAYNQWLIFNSNKRYHK